MLDFNEQGGSPERRAQGDADQMRDRVRVALIDNVESVLMHLLPAGVIKRNCFYVGNIYGAAGDSLEVVLTGPKTGLWTDRAEGTGGEGASLAELVQATAWQQHTVRGAMAGALKKKLGLNIVSEKTDGQERKYRIV